MSFQACIFLGLLVTALAFTIPGDLEGVYEGLDPVENDISFLREPRSTQGRLKASFEQGDRNGSRVNFDFFQPNGQNLEVDTGVARNYERSDNNAHGTFRFGSSNFGAFR